MITYRISAQKAAAERPLALKRNAVITVVAVLVGIAIGAGNLFHGENIRQLFIMVFTIGLFLAFVLLYNARKTRRFLDEAYSTFEISADHETITKTQKNTPTVTLSRSEIRRIEEHQSKGFRVCTDDPGRNIWVPYELESYDQFKAELLASGSVTLVRKQHAWARTYLVLVLLLGLMVIQATARNKVIAGTAALVLFAYLAVSSFSIYRNPNVTRQLKRRTFVFFAVSLVFLIRGILILRS